MIGFDDIFDCYLSTEIDSEIDENEEIHSNFINFKNEIQVKSVENDFNRPKMVFNYEKSEEEMAPLSEPSDRALPKLKSDGSSDVFYDVIEKPIDSPILFEMNNFEIAFTDENFESGIEGNNFFEPELNGALGQKETDILNNPSINISSDEPPCSLQLTAPDYSQILNDSPSVHMSKYFINESQCCNEFCRLCNEEHIEESDPDDWLICYGCGEAIYRKCPQYFPLKIKCEFPIIYRNRITEPSEGRNRNYSHAPWFCNNCVECSSCCPGKTDPNENDKLKQENYKLKNSFVSCRHCGKVSCLFCYNCEPISNGSIEIGKFGNLSNYSCSNCLQCINCGLNASINEQVLNRRKSTSTYSTGLKNQTVLLYDDFTLCRPCYLSNQICATCPRCKQIYHSLTDHYDFGEAPFASEFSLCPMVSCDECGSWTHCQCEGIGEDEYERLGSSKDAKFICVDCKANPIKSKKSKSANLTDKTIFRRGNLMCPDTTENGEDKILFMFWSFDEAWKRCLYEFRFMKRHFMILCPKNIKIEAESLENLSRHFSEKFQEAQKSKDLTCFKAVKPQFLLNPKNLLNFLESSRKHFEFCDYLREEILKKPSLQSAKTQPIDRVIAHHVKTRITRKRRSSLVNLLSTSKTSSNDLFGGFPTPPTSTSTTGKMTVKFLYMQYLQATRSDSSSRTIDAISQGLALRPSAISGFGLFAMRTFQKNSLLIEYCGEMLTGEDLVNKRDAFYNLLGKRYQQSCYLFRLDELKVLDATHKGNLSRFINHSCGPNCYSRVVQIDGTKKLLIFASKIIETGDEILYDYKFPDEEQKIQCLCGSEKCRKWMN